MLRNWRRSFSARRRSRRNSTGLEAVRGRGSGPTPLVCTPPPPPPVCPAAGRVGPCRLATPPSYRRLWMSLGSAGLGEMCWMIENIPGCDSRWKVFENIHGCCTRWTEKCWMIGKQILEIRARSWTDSCDISMSFCLCRLRWHLRLCGGCHRVAVLWPVYVHLCCDAERLRAGSAVVAVAPLCRDIRYLGDVGYLLDSIDWLCCGAVQIYTLCSWLPRVS